MSRKQYSMSKNLAVAAALALAIGVSSTSVADNRYPENGDLWPPADLNNAMLKQRQAQAPQALTPDASAGCPQKDEQKIEQKNTGISDKPVVVTSRAYFNKSLPYFNQYPGE